MLQPRLRRKCPLCNGEGLLTDGFGTYQWTNFQKQIRVALGIGNEQGYERRFCCQICDSGDVIPIDLERKPDSY